MRWLTEILTGGASKDGANANADTDEGRKPRSPRRRSNEDERERARQEEETILWGVCGVTRRDLAGWMGRIDSQRFTDKNEVIDWLRHEYMFPFAWASRFERIHANGGRPLYGATPPSFQGNLAPEIGEPPPAPARVEQTVEQTRNEPESRPPRLLAARPSRMTPRRRALMARVHANALLVEVQATHAGDDVLASEVAAIYLRLCTENGWEPLRWLHRNGVAHHLRMLNGHDKTYRDTIDDEGRPQRLSVYPIGVSVSARSHRREVIDQVGDVTRRPTAQPAAAAA